ncbi:GntR family transcriptional regulator [bacterium]|nr:GntR family transcriptional regulator [bacterium]
MKDTLIKGLYKKIRLSVLNGAIKPHERIVEQDLAKKYKVSRTPIRETLRLLENEGLITAIPNVGTFVKQHSLDEIKQIYEVRAVLEGYAARLVALCISNQEIRELENIGKGENKAKQSKDRNALVKIDREFHDFIMKKCGNKELARIMELFDYQTLSLYTKSVTHGEYSEKNLSYSHIPIVEAIKKRDLDLAEKLARKHIEEAKEKLMK